MLFLIIIFKWRLAVKYLRSNSRVMSTKITCWDDLTSNGHNVFLDLSLGGLYGIS